MVHLKSKVQTTDGIKSNGKTKDGTNMTSQSSKSVKLKREIGLLEAVAITIGSIIGSGIFVSPKGVLAECGSVGLSLIVWIASGLLSMSGALCYAELGTTFPGSGGTYHYLNKAYGPTISFLYFWITILISAPCSVAILSLTFAKYVTQTFFEIGCSLPPTALSLLAGSTIFLIIFINCFDVRRTLKAQNAFMVAKITALAFIIVAGMTYFFQGHTENFQDPFKGSQTDPGSIAISFYSGFFSYGGWAALNLMTEELIEPNKNLPRAIYISLPLITVIYVLANMAYFAVLSPAEMLLSDAIAITFGQKLFGSLGGLISLFVAISTFGALVIHTMSSSRLLFVAARDGNCPVLLSHIKVSRLSPAPALTCLGFLSLFYLSTSNIYALINYAAFIDSFANLAVIVGMLWLRKKEPNRDRPIKVSLFYPILYLMTCILVVALPTYIRPLETLLAVVITASGLPIYYFLVVREHPKWLAQITDKLTCISQKIFMAVSED